MRSRALRRRVIHCVASWPSRWTKSFESRRGSIVVPDKRCRPLTSVLVRSFVFHCRSVVLWVCRLTFGRERSCRDGSRFISMFIEITLSVVAIPAVPFLVDGRHPFLNQCIGLSLSFLFSRRVVAAAAAATPPTRASRQPPTIRHPLRTAPRIASETFFATGLNCGFRGRPDVTSHRGGEGRWMGTLVRKPT